MTGSHTLPGKSQGLQRLATGGCGWAGSQRAGSWEGAPSTRTPGTWTSSHRACPAEGSECLFLWHLSLGVGSLKSCQSRLVLFGVRTERALSHGSSVPCSIHQLTLEEPIETAILLSLVGVRSILANQWPTTLQDNALRANILWESAWCQPGPYPEPPWKPAVGGRGEGPRL